MVANRLSACALPTKGVRFRLWALSVTFPISSALMSAADKVPTPKSPAAAQAASAYALTPLLDQRPAAAVQRQTQQAINASLRVQQATTLQRALNGRASATGPAAPVQRQEAPQENTTGLPDELKAGVENLSGHSLDDVRVHYNSAQPAQLQAHAYAQGTDIHVAPGQEQHLPHEAWHVVQQKQGRVRPTMQMKGAVSVNADARLEKEADMMGGKALQMMAVDRDTSVSDLRKKGPELPSSIAKTSPVTQFVLPAYIEEWTLAHNDVITAGGATDKERATFGLLHYIVELVQPFLETRYDYIRANAKVDTEIVERNITFMKGRLAIAGKLYEDAKRPTTSTKFQDIEATYEAKKLGMLIELANDKKLPKTMENTHASAGGYAADSTMRSDMPALGRTLNYIAMGEGGPVPLTPAPAATATKATKAVPRMSKATFLGSEAIPPRSEALGNGHLHSLEKPESDGYTHGTTTSGKIQNPRSDRCFADLSHERARHYSRASGCLRWYSSLAPALREHLPGKQRTWRQPLRIRRIHGD